MTPFETTNNINSSDGETARSMRQRTRDQRRAGDAARGTGEHLAPGANGAGGTTDQGGLENQMENQDLMDHVGGMEAHGASGTGELLATSVSQVSQGDLVVETPDGRESVATANNNNIDDEPPTTAIRRLEQYFNDNEITAQSYVRTEEFTTNNNELRAHLDNIQTHLDTAKNNSKALEERVDKMDTKMDSNFAGIMEGMANLKDMMNNMTTLFANKDDVAGIKQQVTEIKESNETWLKEQLEKIDDTIADAKQKATKYYQDGVEVMHKQVTKQVDEFAAKQIMSAKDTLSNFAAKTVEYSEEIQKTNQQCTESLEKIKLYESKYHAASKELEGYKSSYAEYLSKVENMDKEMEAIRQIVGKSTDQAQEKIQKQLDEIKTLSKDVTDNRTDIERTVKECKDECKATMEKVDQAKEDSRRIFTEYKTVEGFCKKILKQENTRDQVLFDRMAKIERDMAANNLDSRDQTLFNRINKLENELLIVNQKREHDALSATGTNHAIEELQNEVATVSQLLHEQTNRIGPTQRADETKVVQSINQHSKTDPAVSQDMIQRMEAVQRQLDATLSQPTMTDERVIVLIKDNFQENWVREIVKHMLPKEREIKELCREGYEDYDKKVQQEIYKTCQEMLDKAKAAELSLEERSQLLLNAKDEVQANVLGGVMQELSNLVEKTTNDVQAKVLETVLNEMKATAERQDLQLATHLTQAIEQVRNSQSHVPDENSKDGSDDADGDESGKNGATSSDKNGSTEQDISDKKNRGGNPNPDDGNDEEKPHHSGYVHLQTREKAIAYLPDAHRKLVENNFLWKKDFDGKADAIRWLNETDDQSDSSANKNNDSNQKSAHPFRTPWSRVDRNGMELPPFSSPSGYSSPDYKSDHSPDGYFEDGTPFYTDRRGKRHPLRNFPPNHEKAGQYVPNQHECDRMQWQFERDEYRDKYGMSPPSPYGQDEYHERYGRRPPSDDFRYSSQERTTMPEHPGRREEYRNPSREPRFQEAVYDDGDMKQNYLFGRMGTSQLQPSDFHRLGFTNPGKSCQVLTVLHSRLINNYETYSKFDGVKRGPDITRILSSTAFTPLESRTQNAVIDWFNNLAQVAIVYNIAICPFEHIELVYGPPGICIPGVGEVKYDEMGRDLYTLLSSKLLPMQVNADDSELAQELKLATDTSVPNGYDLLHILLRKLVPAFDFEHNLELPWPKFSSYDTVLSYALAVEQTVLMASKRKQRVSPKNAALQFLQGVINEAHHDYRLQAQIIKTALQPLPAIGPLPDRFDLKRMAVDITKSKPKEQDDPDLSKNHSIYRTAITHNAATNTSTNTVLDMAVEASQQLNHEHMQGFKYETYCVNEAVYRPRDGRRRRSSYPVPDPKNNVKRRPSTYDASITCAACGQRGHNAVRCFALAAAIYLQQFMSNKGNEDMMQRSVEHWKQRNQPILRDAQTNEPLNKNPLQVLRAYMDKSGLTMEKMVSEVDWDYFDERASEREVFGYGSAAPSGSMVDESE